jgi:hypothetical protein
VIGQQVGEGLELVAVHGFERPADPLVEGLPLRPQQGVVHGLLSEDVLERVLPLGARVVG